MGTKTPWRKNLDKRYISGEDLQDGIALNKGLRPEMVVTLAKFNDAPTFDQKSNVEVTKTAIWLKEYPSGKMLYKPVILNVENAEFLSKEIGGDTIFIDDSDFTKPFILYAKPDKRHGFVARFRKYFPKQTTDPKRATDILNKSTTLEELKANWGVLTKEEQVLPAIIKIKEDLKTKLK